MGERRVGEATCTADQGDTNAIEGRKIADEDKS